MFQSSFVDETVRLFDSLLKPKILKIWFSQNQVYDKLTPKQKDQISSHSHELEYRSFSVKTLRTLESKEKVTFFFFLQVVRLAKEDFKDEDPIIRLWVDDICGSLSKICAGSEIISVFSQLTDPEKVLYLQEFFDFQEFRKRIYFSILLGSKKNTGNLEKRSLLQKILDKDSLFPEIRLIQLKKARKPQFRKGYRDHGSLGSDLSRIRREERDDRILQELETQRLKNIQDRTDLIRGWLW